jgi:hypothetical protein
VRQVDELGSVLAFVANWRAQRRRMRDTGRMAYHEAFWVAVAAAAPVIALANTVTMTDVAGVWLDAKVKRRSSIAREVYIGVLVFSGSSLLTQAYYLYRALQSLIAQNDAARPRAVAFYVAFGLLAVLVLVVYDVILRYILRNTEAQERTRLDRRG